MFGLLLAAHGKYFAVCFWDFCRLPTAHSKLPGSLLIDTIYYTCTMARKDEYISSVIRGWPPFKLIARHTSIQQARCRATIIDHLFCTVIHGAMR
jgi:hypothetical protein